ncbi:MAG: alpha/beta fold hydrolase, partial [Actinobacteria bacterium]
MATDVNSLRLFVRYDEGDGPVMVLLHGINSDAQDWRPVIDRIGTDYRIIAPDVLGFGESEKPTDINYTADEHALVLENTLKDLGVVDPFLLVGYSLGGDIAIRYASKYPSRVRRLFMLSAPFYLPPQAFSKGKFGVQFLSEIVFKRMWKLIARSKRNDNAVYRLVSGRLEDFAKGFLRTGDVPKHWDIMSKNLVNCIGAADFINDLPKLTMPTVFALGIRDPIVHPDQTPALKRLKPDMEIRRIVGLSADHFMLMNLPDRVADEIMRDEIRTLNVAWRGGTGEPLMLLPGIDTSAQQWIPAAEALAASNDVAVIDMLGFGDSPRPMSAGYTMAEHVTAIANTARTLWGKDPRVRLAGFGFGGLVALGAAAAFPRNVTSVVAFSPLLVEKGSIEGRVRDRNIAEVLAARDAAVAYAQDERASIIASDSVEARLVPALRSITNTVLATDADEPLRRVNPPTTFVVPTEDTIVDLDYLRAHEQALPNMRVVTPEGDRFLPVKNPAAAVRAIDPGRADEITAASSAKAVRLRKRRNMADLVRGVDNALLRKG